MVSDLPGSASSLPCQVPARFVCADAVPTSAAESSSAWKNIFIGIPSVEVQDSSFVAQRLDGVALRGAPGLQRNREQRDGAGADRGEQQPGGIQGGAIREAG